MQRRRSDDESSIGEALKRHDIKPSLYQKWMDQPHFFEAFKKAREIRCIMAETDPTAEPNALRQQIDQRSATQVAQAPPDPAQAPPAEQPAPRQPEADRNTALRLSEREWVQSINGEEGVQAYDRLVELWKKYEQPAPTDPPNSNGVPPPVEHVHPPELTGQPNDTA